MLIPHVFGLDFIFLSFNDLQMKEDDLITNRYKMLQDFLYASNIRILN